MSTTGLPTTLLRRNIGRAFRQLRENKKLTIEQVALQLDRARATIGRIEQGAETIRFRETDVRAMLDLYDADPHLRDQLLGWTRETRSGNKSWWNGYSDSVLPERMRLFIALEEAAETIREYEPELIPGLLQTRAYARAVLSTPAGYVSEEETNLSVQVRLDRQEMLARPRAPRLEVVLNEAVIRRQVGSPELMAEQIEHLLTVGRQNNIVIKIVPFEAGLHGGMVAGSFYLLDFPSVLGGESFEPPLAYSDTITGALYLNQPEDIETYRQIWRDLNTRSLNENQTRDLLRTALKGFTS